MKLSILFSCLVWWCGGGGGGGGVEVCVRALMCIHICVPVCRDHRSVLGFVLFLCHLPCFLSWHFSCDLVLTIRLTLLSSDPHRSAYLYLSTGIPSAHHHIWLFCMGSGDQTQVSMLGGKHFTSWAISTILRGNFVHGLWKSLSKGHHRGINTSVSRSSCPQASWSIQEGTSRCGCFPNSLWRKYFSISWWRNGSNNIVFKPSILEGEMTSSFKNVL